MWRNLMILFLSTGCGGVAWDTTLASEPVVRRAMVDSVRVGITTESQFMTRWGRPTQRVREGAETRLIYRSMTNPQGYHFPQFGSSHDYVIAVFQYGQAVSAYSSDTEGCRATFAPRPPGQAFDNPSTVHPVNCGLAGASGGGAPLNAVGGGVAPDEYGNGRPNGTGSGAGRTGKGAGRSGPGKL